jgi:hypothetical protein
MACTKALISSAVTPRSKAMRSMSWSRSRLISSLMPLLAFGIGVVGDDQLAADDADGDRGHLLLQDLEGGEQPVDVAAEERMAGRVELRGADARGESAQQLLVVAGPAGLVKHE